MARQVRFPHPKKGDSVPGTELDFRPTQEAWNVYECEDGTLVRVKLIVSRIVRIDGETNEIGDPMFAVVTNAVVATQPAPKANPA